MITQIVSKYIQSKTPWITTYHGTDARFLPKILQDGLKAQKPGGRHNQGVYLTKDLEKAARYAVDGIEKEHGKPAILELRIPPQIVKKIYRDPLDRTENAFENDDVDGHYLTEAFRQLEDDVKRILEKFSGKMWSIPKEIASYIEDSNDGKDLEGLNLYKLLISYARDNKFNLQQFKQVLQKQIPPGTNYGGYFEVMDDGTIHGTESLYDSYHQQVYPNNIDPKYIRSIWLTGVPEGSGGETMVIKSKLLPHETKAKYDAVLRLVGNYINNKDTTPEDVMQFADDLEGIDSEGWFTDIVEEAQLMADEFGDQDISGFDDILLNLEQSVYDEWDQDQYGSSTTFTQVSPDQALTFLK